MMALRLVFYGMVCGGLVGGAVLDALAREPKHAIVACLFAAANALVFFWR